jgi:hypothetical protein
MKRVFPAWTGARTEQARNELELKKMKENRVMRSGLAVLRLSQHAQIGRGGADA